MPSGREGPESALSLSVLPRPFGVLRLYSRCSVQLCPHHRALKPRSPPHPKRFPHGRRTGLCRGEVVGLVPPHQGCSERADLPVWGRNSSFKVWFVLGWNQTQGCLHHKPPQSKTICLGSSLHVWLCLCFLLYF